MKSIKRCSYNDIDKSFLPVATKLLFNFQVFHFTYARNTSQFLSVSCVEASLCCGEAEEKEKDSARGTMGRGMREERLPPFSSSHRPRRAFYFFDYCYLYRDTQREPLRRRESFPPPFKKGGEKEVVC